MIEKEMKNISTDDVVTVELIRIIKASIRSILDVFTNNKTSSINLNDYNEESIYIKIHANCQPKLEGFGTEEINIVNSEITEISKILSSILISKELSTYNDNKECIEYVDFRIKNNLNKIENSFTKILKDREINSMEEIEKYRIKISELAGIQNKVLNLANGTEEDFLNCFQKIRNTCDEILKQRNIKKSWLKRVSEQKESALTFFVPDVNGDGKIDIITANLNADITNSENTQTNYSYAVKGNLALPTEAPIKWAHRKTFIVDNIKDEYTRTKLQTHPELIEQIRVCTTENPLAFLKIIYGDYILYAGFGQKELRYLDERLFSICSQKCVSEGKHLREELPTISQKIDAKVTNRNFLDINEIATIGTTFKSRIKKSSQKL